ncbi:hypothetical protein D3P07_21685 [Paenibacillus sp. 1011MAR3C5]|uniref:zf-HC2 domain-containing protein n=1 Tax=Paenibacillus sp. 1011MAR3C5 TaxID=1675787 RepID=UPI000E6D52D2|nr:zf-HC2 domain-containing protein [Paenibacillus sp. 1011MAR3C5]RJE85181.1 hypothetical protein D3P07_21685 [Paenibacillus sp. 1011MAR3C5]
MSTSCNIVYDLLPLYVDGACSAESRAYVDEHLLDCPACRKKYEAMAQPITVDILLGIQEDAEQSEGVEEQQQRDHAAKSVLRRIKRRWLLSLIPLLLLIPLLFLGINQYRGVGMSFTNLYDHYAASQFLTALEKRDYEKAFSYINMSHEYDNIQEGLKRSAETLAFNVEDFESRTDENGILYYTNGKTIYTEEHIKAMLRQYEEYPWSKATDKVGAQKFIEEYQDVSYEEFYQRSKENFIANMKEWERLGYTLAGHRVKTSYANNIDGVMHYSFSYYLSIKNGKQTINSGTIDFVGTNKGKFSSTGGSYFPEDTLTPRLLDRISIYSFE